MKPLSSHRPRQAGSVLVSTLVFAGILMILTAGTLQLSGFRLKTEYGRWRSTQAYYHAENALSWAVQKIGDASSGGASAPFRGQYSVSEGTLNLAYMQEAYNGGDPLFRNAWVVITNDPSGTANLYQITSSCTVGDHTRTVRATLRKNPPSVIFDYEYFLNNWGWWWGSSIIGNGGNRANWDFDFRFNPTVNGTILASGEVASDKVPVNPFTNTPPFLGLAASDPVTFVKSGVPRVQMPNLKDLSYYQQKASNMNGTISVGSDVVVNAVHTNATKPGLYLAGSSAAPIKVNGPVVIPGDLVIKGVITGIGTFYVGGRLYVAGDLTYANGPDFSTPPETMTAANRDAWVQNALSSQKDLVAFAVREAVYGGNPNSSEWKAYCFDPPDYGLHVVGAEANLGADGIANTPDDGVPYLDTDGDGVPDSAWYDADGDGVVDSAYNYSNDIVMSNSRASAIYNYPTNSSGLVSYDTVASNNMNRLDAIVYSNHAVAMRLAKNDTLWNGTVVSRDEAIVFNSTLKFNYDSRIHSRYSNDPNRYIDLGLPVANLARIERFVELRPVAGFYTGP